MTIAYAHWHVFFICELWRQGIKENINSLYSEISQDGFRYAFMDFHEQAGFNI